MAPGTKKYEINCHKLCPLLGVRVSEGTKKFTLYLIGRKVHKTYQKVVVEADKRELRVKKSAPNDNVKIGYYSFFLLSNDRKRSYESIGMVIY